MKTSPLRVTAVGVVSLASLALIGTAIAGPASAHTTKKKHVDTTPSVSLKRYREQVPAIGKVGNVTVRGDGFGSAVAAVPGHSDEIYGLTDRGPNVNGPGGTKIEPFPTFTPAIGLFKLADGKAKLLKRIPLESAGGHKFNGLVNTVADTGETITKLDGSVLPKSPYGYDSEGLVALKDGTFWVSDEYGPFITHFSAKGRQISRFSPYDGTLPAELKLRTPNKGMEGLTITPDGKTLVGIMQSALSQTDAGKSASVAVTRIVTIDVKTKKTHEYAYVLDAPAVTGSAVSEIAALSSHEFVVDERDGNFEPGAYKKLWKIDIAKATDIGPTTTAGTYDATRGVLLGGKTLEAVAGTGTAAAATTALTTAGVTPVTKTIYLDLGALVSGLGPDGSFFGHDKVEGLSILNGGKRLIISNDSDFGIDNSTGDAAPFGLHTKKLPTGQQDFGEYLVIDRK